jgi:hypothetical protein
MKYAHYCGIALLIVFALGCSTQAGAGEHGGQEHGGQEHGGTQHEGSHMAAPSAETLRQTIRDHIAGKSPFMIDDTVTGQTRTLEFVRVHDRVGKTGNAYYSCTDMRDVSTGELLDLDFDVMHDARGLHVREELIHKVTGESQPRHTYDVSGNRVSATPPTSASQEHGGQEHGGQEHGGGTHREGS